MENKQKQIEEMAFLLTQYEKSLCDRLQINKCLLTSKIHAQVSCDYCKIAEYLIGLGYRKIPENAVVIDKNENPCLSCPVPKSEREIADCSTICGAIQLGIDWKNQCRVLVRDYYRLEKDYKNLRKETAEKFAERLKEYFKENGGIYYRRKQIHLDLRVIQLSKIDEICKELTEGKV